MYSWSLTLNKVYTGLVKKIVNKLGDFDIVKTSMVQVRIEKKVLLQKKNKNTFSR